MAKRPTAEMIAEGLTVSECVLLFCVASDTDWRRAGVKAITNAETWLPWRAYARCHGSGRARASPYRALCAGPGCSVTEANAALDAHPIELDRDQFLCRTPALELLRLDELEEAFHHKAILQKDTASAAILIKLYERRTTLPGLNPPQGHAVQIIQHEPAAAQTSTEKIRAAIDRIRCRSLPKLDDLEKRN